VTLVERSSAPRSSGAPVDVRRDALAVVRELGVEERVRAADTGARRIAFVDREGRVRARADLRREASPDIEIARAALGAALLDRAAAVADVVRGDGPRALRADDRGVDVEFEGGAVRRFDLVVGADGQHSTVRRLVWGPEDGFRRPVGLAIATVPVPVDVDPEVVLLHNEPGTSTGIHPAGGRPIASFIFRTDDAAVSREELRARYAGVGWRAPELIALAAGADDLYLDTVSRVSVPSWSSGRIMLLGDAASSVTILGEGSSTALLGASRLAAALREEQEPAIALGRYERAVRPEVARRQRGVGLGAAFLVPRTARGIAIRDRLVRLRGRV
jgi:2-polyprenyl-6-methoxyphenol hydroxylase-like FAD-dependent oxidoreductase